MAAPKMRISLSGMLYRIREYLEIERDDGFDGEYYAHALVELEGHLRELRVRTEGGEAGVVHEFLDLYTFEDLDTYEVPKGGSGLSLIAQERLLLPENLQSGELLVKGARVIHLGPERNDSVHLGSHQRPGLGQLAEAIVWGGLPGGFDVGPVEAASATKAESQPGGPDGSENPGQEWDHEIRWDSDEMGEGAEFAFPLQDGLLHMVTTAWPALPENPATHAHGDRPGSVRVWGLAPGLGETWLVQATGPDASPLLDSMEQEEIVAIRLGWAHPDALKRLPEFTGW